MIRRSYNAVKRLLGRLHWPQPALPNTLSLPRRFFLIFAFTSIGLGMNFFFFTPAFNPYEIPIKWIGGCFLGLGLFKLAALYLLRSLMLIRLSMASCMFFMGFWGVGTALSFPETSLQLPTIFLIALVPFQFCLLLAPFVSSPLKGVTEELVQLAQSLQASKPNV